jgi:hypothetical protein
MTTRISACACCTYLRAGQLCPAFPLGIPDYFFFGYALHDKNDDPSLPVFTPAPGCASIEWFQSVFSGQEHPQDRLNLEDLDESDPDEILVTEIPGESDPMEKSYDELGDHVDDDHVEFCSGLFQKGWVRSHSQNLLEALGKTVHQPRFVKIAPQEVELVYQDIIDTMLNPDGWSVREIMDKLQAKFPDLTDFEAERIARTETQKVANKARELQFEAQDRDSPEPDKYVWLGSYDRRTTDICREIMDQSKDGLSIEDLKALIHKVQTAHGMKDVGDWCPHPKCRKKLSPWMPD